MRCTLDYETRSKAPLKIVGAIEYSKHYSTSIFCLGYKIDDGPRRLWIPERAPMPLDLWKAFKSGVLVAHNAPFERAVTKHVLTRYDTLTSEQRFTLYNLPPSRWRCTAAKAAACGLPRKLEAVAEILETITQKDMAGHKLTLKYSKPRKPSKHNPKEWWDDKHELRRIYRYCLDDVQAEYEVDEALPDLTAEEQKLWELDQIVNDRGVLIDIPSVKRILGLIAEETENATREVQELSKGTIESATKVAQVLAWINDRGAEMPNLQAATIRDKLLEKGLDPKVRRMLELRQIASKTSTKKYIAMTRVVGSDFRARELLLFLGAPATGRWAGKRLQPQNFPRPTIKGFNSDEAIALINSGGIEAIRVKYGRTKVMDVLVSCVRGMLIPSLGHEFFCADFAAVEARLAFWVAFHEEGIRAFVENRKLYEEMASDAFGVDLDWLLTEEGKASLERFVGKESILGCQYGMGWKKFQSQCAKKGIIISADMAKKAVYTYRKKHRPVTIAWAAIEHACVQAIRNPGARYKTNRVVIYMSGKFLCIRLPSGRRLRYFKPRVSHKQLASGRMVPQIHHWAIDQYSKAKHKWVEVVTWGGTLFNNIVQGIARDLMANSMQKIEKAEYRFLLSIHDEALSERKKGCGDLKEYLHLMSGKLPAWAEGAPIRCEGWVGPRYKK